MPNNKVQLEGGRTAERRILKMYETKVENDTRNEVFSVQGNIDISVLREESDGIGHYCLFKISLLGRDTYGICVLGNGHAVEIVGEEQKTAESFFERILLSSPSPCHLFDIVVDFRRESEL